MKTLELHYPMIQENEWHWYGELMLGSGEFKKPYNFKIAKRLDCPSANPLEPKNVVQSYPCWFNTIFFYFLCFQERVIGRMEFLYFILWYQKSII